MRAAQRLLQLQQRQQGRPLVTATALLMRSSMGKDLMLTAMATPAVTATAVFVLMQALMLTRPRPLLLLTHQRGEQLPSLRQLQQ